MCKRYVQSLDFQSESTLDPHGPYAPPHGAHGSQQELSRGLRLAYGHWHATRGGEFPTVEQMWHWMGWKGCSTQHMPMDDQENPPNAAACRKAERSCAMPMTVVTTAPTREVLATYARPRIEQFLQERGLALKAAKTRSVPSKEGLNFLGFHLRKCGKQGTWLTVPHKAKGLRHVRATRASLDAPKPTPAGQGSKARNPVIRGWANVLSVLCGQTRLSKGSTGPMAEALDAGETPTPAYKQDVGESPLFSERRLLDMLGRQGGTGEARRHPDHTLHEGHREACPLCPSPAPILDGAQEAASEKGNLRETTAEAAPETGIPMRSVSHPMHSGRKHSNGSYSPYKPRWNRRYQDQTPCTPLVPSATPPKGRATTAKGLSRMRGNSHVRFLGGWKVATSSGYPVPDAQRSAPFSALGV